MSKSGKRARSVFHHLPVELLVVEQAVPVGVRLPDHHLGLLAGHLETHLVHGVVHLGRRDEPVAVAVENPEIAGECGFPVCFSNYFKIEPERLDDVLLTFHIGHLLGHEREEFVEIDRASAVAIDLLKKER